MSAVGNVAGAERLTDMLADDRGPEHLMAAPDRLLPAVLQRLEDGHERGQQLHPGHSSVGGCRRQAGYGYAGTEPDPEWTNDASVQAWIGTAVHRAFLPVLRQLLHPARIELATTWQPLIDQGAVWGPVVLPPITGHVDLYRRRSQLVLDLKTVSRHQLDYVRREGARRRDVLQVHANAASLTAEGKPCTHVALLYVCTETSADRSDQAGLLIVMPVDPQVTAEAVTWWAEVTGTDPEQLPRDERGPGLSWKCDGCPFLRRCWGPDAVPGQVGGQQVLAVENDAVVSALAMLEDAQTRYADAGRLQRAADADKAFAAAILEGTPEGAYQGSTGVRYDLTWSKGQLRTDEQQLAEVLGSLNIGVPKRRTASKPKAKRVSDDG